MLGPIILQIVLICLNAIFAAAEIAVISVNEAKLEKMVEEGNKRAKKLLALTRDSSKVLSTIQVAITLAALLGSAYAADSFANPLVDWLQSVGLTMIPTEALQNICVLLITIVLSYFSIVCGELVPKRIAMKYAESLALGLSGLLRFVQVCFAPFVWVLTVSTNGLLRLFHINPDEESEPVTEEEIRLMLDTGSEHGTIDSMENEMIQNIFEFDDTSVSEVCTHRREVVLLYEEDGIDEWRKTVTETRHGFYPICGEDADDIVAILNSRKFFRTECATIEDALREASEKPYFVPANTKADVLFNNMKESRNYFAVVVDEYGGTMGVITLHDLLELLVGDLGDKDEVVVEDIRQLDEDRYAITGSAMLEEVAKTLGIDFEDEECDTFGGYIFGQLGAVPDDGTTCEIETERLSIHVDSVVDHRIEQTTVILKPAPEEDEDEKKSKDKEKDKDKEKENEKDKD
ncbi:MAG: HlyC/CorC family transporter [Clostridia bacterium]|nr:HlyC/CorC family transporter [Clostridia bacterium]